MPDNITDLEVKALIDGVNLSDGHPRMSLSDSQSEIVAAFSDIFAETRKVPVDVVERAARSAFLSSIGQHAALAEDVEFRSCYSSSTAIDMIGKAIRLAGREVVMVEPTFDNLHDLLAGHGLTIRSVAEDELATGSLAEVVPAHGVLFTVSPNNPTGTVIGADRLHELAAACAERGTVLVIDSCFRAQDLRAQYDMYAVLGRYELDWAIIEDTGKLWPLQELKTGFLNWNAGNPLPLARMYSDHMLSASPFILRVVELFAEDGRHGGYDRLRGGIQSNRTLAREHINLAPAYPESRISVDTFRLPDGVEAGALYAELGEVGVHVLPGELFYWAQPKLGTDLIRISLARDPEAVVTGCRRVDQHLEAWRRVVIR
ncbi:aspartate/methionine/tyrosine aminotransferase [Nocardia tenerifensis]|uniref:Aspartate/methionine/tyrosine aminotransferase n=1 Tax=Nocardia tenerifensis TaxID=228006 RepID=A0A318KNJ3_9NOCA|nr:pyridoxal phosphate-dependent aminotransferase [Nocardia tenerifensis]PXX71240.1 aspartate/methionine/tyrosine aminotransferase [Nocardia tenerifensis]